MSRDITEAAVLDPLPATAGKLTPQARLVGKDSSTGVYIHSFVGAQIPADNYRETA